MKKKPDPEPTKMRLHIGGVLRCCAATVGEPEHGPLVPDGTKIACRYCKGEIIAFKGAWYWDGCPEVAKWRTKRA